MSKSCCLLALSAANPSCICVGCAIVKGDHAPDCGVAQGVVHGVIGHHGKKQEEVEEELKQEVERQEEENAQTPVRMTMTMDEMERHCEALSQCDSVNRSDDTSTNGAQCAQ